jgi:hypothetical protein
MYPARNRKRVSRTPITTGKPENNNIQKASFLNENLCGFILLLTINSNHCCVNIRVTKFLWVIQSNSKVIWKAAACILHRRRFF